MVRGRFLPCDGDSLRTQRRPVKEGVRVPPESFGCAAGRGSGIRPFGVHCLLNKAQRYWESCFRQSFTSPGDSTSIIFTFSEQGTNAQELTWNFSLHAIVP